MASSLLAVGDASKQQDLFPPTLQRRVLKRLRDFEALFDGFERLSAVSYVASPALLLEFVRKRGIRHVDLVLGLSMVPTNTIQEWRSGLSKEPPELVGDLCRLVEEKTLRILVPPKTIHTKLYILERPGLTRVIQSSANLTESAKQGRQVNYAWFMDFPEGHPGLAALQKDFEEHCEGATTFMGDLMETFQEKPDSPRHELVDAWLKGRAEDDQDLGARPTLQQLSAIAMEEQDAEAGTSRDAVISLRLPESPGARRQVEKMLAPIKQGAGPGELRVGRNAWTKFVEESHGFPLLRVDATSRTAVLGLAGQRVSLTGGRPEPAVLAAGLRHVEAYVETVDAGQAPDPRFARAAMFEALLYMLFSPFASDYMTRRRREFGSVDSRGPRALYLYGPSQNGKSTFLRFALQLIAGRHMRPLAGDQFKKARLLQATAIGTCFPLVFDDVAGFQDKANEEALKSYWENWWNPDFVQPQLVVSSNGGSLKDWAKSRVKRVDFDVHFPPSEENKRRLARLFEQPNDLFRWFATLYLERVANESVTDDELHVARQVIGDLYERAGLERPEYFPTQPLEASYDSGRKSWRDVLFVLKKAKLVRERGRIVVHFASDLQFWEVASYESDLPQTVKHARRGNTLVIESPEEFGTWLDGGARRVNWFSRLLGRG